VTAPMATARAAQSRPEVTARPGRCGPAQVLTWLGLSGRPGTARGVVVPLEFSNVSRRTCTISGWPGVSPLGGRGRPVGPAAVRQRHSRPVLVTLRPGQTAHANLIVGPARFKCRTPAKATTIRIQGPGFRAAQRIGLIFRVCARRATMSVGSVRRGAGIP
jgi:Protein of unknown function (DUF4232)